VFALLDRYSLAASDVIQRHGGWLVDLEGDGLMAAFGAPQPLPNKERAALGAAREIAALAPSLHGGEISNRPALGVGIATGPGFAGFLRAVDYSVWSVVGETTNRASRLQQLARDRGVEIVLDEPTVRACGEAGAQLTPLGPIALRGLSEPCEVWATRARA
jgi:class 3 adenylate cyclase